DAVRVVIQFAHQREDALARAFGYARLVVDDQRDGLIRHIRLLGDVADGERLTLLAHAFVPNIKAGSRIRPRFYFYSKLHGFGGCVALMNLDYDVTGQVMSVPISDSLSRLYL